MTGWSYLFLQTEHLQTSLLCCIVL